MLEAECAEVDEFVASYKSLVGFMPFWVDCYHRDWQVRWTIADENDVQKAELVIVSDRTGKHISFSVMFRSKPIYRLDVEPPGPRHPNPHGAHLLGLPPFVEGSHVHDWGDNKAYVIRNGFGELPFRRPLEGPVHTLSDGLGWIAEHLGVTVKADQRICELPRQELF